MKRFLLTMTGFLAVLCVRSQTINIDLSHFGGKSYFCLAVQGQKEDTIAKGKLDKSGKAVIVFKDRFKGYKGMSRFLLTDGGGLDLVINKENFTVSCKETAPGYDNIHFTGSPENEYFLSHSAKKTKLLQKAELAKVVLATYTTADAVYAPFEKEQGQLNEQYKAIRNTNAQSPLYAARVIEIYDFLMNSPSDLKDSAGQQVTASNNFVLSKVNFDDLYTSNAWQNVLSAWLNLQLQQSKSDAQILSDLQQIGARMKSNAQFTDLPN